MSDARIELPKTLKAPLYQGVVTAAVAPLYDEDSLKTGLQTELIHGHIFTVYREGDNWVWGQASPLIKGSARKGYIGFVAKADIEAYDGIDATHCITALRAPLFSQANIKSPIERLLPLNARFAIKGDDEGFVETVTGHFIHSRHVRALSAPAAIQDYVTVAERYLGAPYVWGGTGLRGVDCSGLVQMSLCAAGIDAPRDANMQEADLGVSHEGELKRGDLIFWPGHVGVMSDESTLLHANAFHMCTEKEPYKTAKARIGNPRSIKRL